MEKRAAIPGLYCAVATGCILTGYLLVLVGRTGYLTRSASIGIDVIVGYHALCALGAATLIAVKRSGIGGKVADVALGAHILVWAAFLLLNLTGKVWQQLVDEPDSLWDLIRTSLS